MHYQGTKVPLSERNDRFKTAGIPARRSWGSRGSALSSRWEKPEEDKKFSFKMFAGKPEVKPVSTNYAFYRPGAMPAKEDNEVVEKFESFKRGFLKPGNLSTASFSKKEQNWKMPALHTHSLKPLAWLAAAAVLLMVGWFAKQKATWALQDASNLKLSKVIVEGAHYLTEDEVVKKLDLQAGTPMFKLNLEDLNKKIQQLSWVDKVFVERRLPSSLLISLRERKPVALLDNGSLYGVDKDGRILSPSDALVNQDLPLISGVRFGPDAVGTTQNAAVLKPALDFFAFMGKKDDVMAHDVSEVNLSEPDAMKVTFINGVQVTFNNTVTDEDLKRMAMVLADLNEKGKKAGTMDFRYRDMVFVRTR